MEKRFTDSTLGEIIYTESVFSGRKKIFVNGKELKKQSKNVYVTESGEQVTIKGSFYQGVELVIGVNKYQVSERLKWYEYLTIILPLVFNLIWGNSVTLCKIIPMIGGALGGLVSALVGALGLVLISKCTKVWQRILVVIGTFVVSVLICYLLALAILSVI